MFKLLGPLGVIIGSAFLTFCRYLDNFFSIPINEISDVEDDVILRKLSYVFRRTEIEEFNDIQWVQSFKKYYHVDIKELRDAENILFIISDNIKGIKKGLIGYSLLLIIIGAIYTSAVNLQLINDSFFLSTIDATFYFFSGFFIYYICRNTLTYLKKIKQYEEIITNQKNLLRRRYFEQREEE